MNNNRNEISNKNDVGVNNMWEAILGIVNESKNKNNEQMKKDDRKTSSVFFKNVLSLMKNGIKQGSNG